ncbi:transcriptional regulator [Candidatus Woesearchaeota archaeon]|jgi:predicted transcriptional regulator|nr:transcriptional regulator [Candidatus Woesearchaeota archaeon]MBT7062369.1 transcriptional regulator [Candidatus Woesearchaeota archaeon]MBT7402338.1 transcriptional regulator [Candidatus Woesearchaeota archaeon]
MLVAIQKAQGKIKPTHLMYKANLSHKLLNSYLGDLIKRDMAQELQVDKVHKFIILTDKGRDFLIQFRKIKEFQESFGL